MKRNHLVLGRPPNYLGRYAKAFSAFKKFFTAMQQALLFSSVVLSPCSTEPSTTEPI